MKTLIHWILLSALALRHAAAFQGSCLGGARNSKTAMMVSTEEKDNDKWKRWVVSGAAGIPCRHRRSVLMNAGLLGGFLGGGSGGGGDSSVRAAATGGAYKSKGPTNEVVKVVNGMKHRRLGGSDILVSELGLGTQRWVSTDFNAPDQEQCFAFMDKAILNVGVNLIDTAEQYPIPSDPSRSPEGATEQLIGKWIKDRKVSRDKVVIATKITGGRNVTPKNIKKDCEGELWKTQLFVTAFVECHSTPLFFFWRHFFQVV
jgi:Aldo/keto reductase family